MTPVGCCKLILAYALHRAARSIDLQSSADKFLLSPYNSSYRVLILISERALACATYEHTTYEGSVCDVNELIVAFLTIVHSAEILGLLMKNAREE